MCHHDYCTAFIEPVQIFYYCPFIFGIKGVCGFIQEDKIWILIDCTGYEDALLLSLAQPDSVFTDYSIVF